MLRCRGHPIPRVEYLHGPTNDETWTILTLSGIEPSTLPLLRESEHTPVASFPASHYSVEKCHVLSRWSWCYSIQGAVWARQPCDTLLQIMSYSLTTGWPRLYQSARFSHHAQGRLWNCLNAHVAKRHKLWTLRKSINAAADASGRPPSAVLGAEPHLRREHRTVSCTNKGRPCSSQSPQWLQKADSYSMSSTRPLLDNDVVLVPMLLTSGHCQIPCQPTHWPLSTFLWPFGNLVYVLRNIWRGKTLYSRQRGSSQYIRQLGLVLMGT